MLHLNVFLEAATFLASLARACFPAVGQALPADAHLVNALAAFWMALISLACSRSKWVALPPPQARQSPQQPLYGQRVYPNNGT